jgi:hypothetical protein
MEKFMMVNG